MSGDSASPRGGARLRRGLTISLVAVSALHALSPLVFRGVHSLYGWDETVYISQIDPHTVASVFSAPRARGLTLLTAPASLISASIALMRLWLAVLSGVGMFYAFLPWLRLRRSAVVPLAALLWSGLWVSVYYSYEAMPNQYVAYGAVSATGWLLLAVRRPEENKRAIWYAGASLAFTALIRPSDAAFVVAVLLVAVLVVHHQTRRWRAVSAAVLAGGFVAGLAEWVIEAFVRFGGPIARLHAASQENGGGIHFSVETQMRVLAGPLLCRRGCHVDASQLARAWWYLGGLLVVIGIVATLRARRATPYVIAAGVGLALALEYFIALGYGAPRFLEPAYALLALPAAEGLAWLWLRSVGAARPVAVVVALALFAGQEGTQLHYLQTADRHQDLGARRTRVIAHFIKTKQFEHPCFVGGFDAGPVAFLSDCHALGPTAPPSPRVHPHGTLIFIQPRRTPADARLATWQSYRLPAGAKGFTIWTLVQPSA